MDKFILQAKQYKIPYYYCITLESFSLHKSYNWGINYVSYIKPIIDFLNNYDYKTLLDIGCGDGFLINNLNSKDKILKGIDIVKEVINWGNSFKTDDNIIFEIQNIKDEKEEYDIVSLIQVLEHIPDNMEEDFLLDTIKCVKKGEFFIISIPSNNDKIPTNFKLVKEIYKSFTLFFEKE